MTYRLRAYYEGRTRTKRIVAGDDTEATFAAIARILDAAADRSSSDRRFWAVGRIELMAPDGRLVHMMNAKDNVEGGEVGA